MVNCLSQSSLCDIFQGVLLLLFQKLFVHIYEHKRKFPRVLFLGGKCENGFFNPKIYFTFFLKFQKGIMNPKCSDSRRIRWIKSKSGFSRWDSIKLFLTSSFPCKNSAQQIRYLFWRHFCYKRRWNS